MELVKWNKARQAIAEARSVDEVKAIKDRFEAMRVYAKQIGESLEVQNNICEIKLRAERRMGEMLKEMPKQYGSRGHGKKVELHNVTSLKDIGIEKIESHRYQKIADLPEKVFERIITETKAEEKELTEALMLNTAKKVDREIKIRQQVKDIESGKVLLPVGKYEVLVVDPPWDYGRKYDPEGSRVANPYPEMSIEELQKIDLPSSNKSVLWLWTTHQFIWDAKKLLEHWGFDYKAIMVWDKEKMGMGSWLRMQCEFCLLGIKGNPLWRGKDIRDIIREARSSHSVKPETLYALIDKNLIGRKLDYFARKKRKGWDTFGDEVT